MRKNTTKYKAVCVAGWAVLTNLACSHRSDVTVEPEPVVVRELALGGTCPDPNADIIYLQKDCTDECNCFTDTTALTTWLWGGGSGARATAPSANDRVAVRMGPGDFEPFECYDQGYVSVIGSGRDASRFVRVEPSVGDDDTACWGAIRVGHCFGMEFGNLQARGDVGVTWGNGGSAKWWNVDMVGVKEGPDCHADAQLAWYDLPILPPATGGQYTTSEHFMFSTRMIARGSTLAYGFDSAGWVDLWFYGGDVVAELVGDENGYGQGSAIGVNMNPAAAGNNVKPVARFFGSTLRAGIGTQRRNGSSSPAEVIAVRLNSDVGPEFHIHGGIIQADASKFQSGLAPTLIGIDTTQHVIVHTPDTAFAILSPPGGSGSRLAGTSTHIMSPFMWPASSNPPPEAKTHAQDMFVETDRGAGNNEAHLMVRDASCTGGGGAWRDMANGACR